MLTTTEAAAYLAAAGYTVKRRRVGGEGPPSADTIKRWCEPGTRCKFPNAVLRTPRLWFIPKEDLDTFLQQERTRR